jgi:hypothetical protein
VPAHRHQPQHRKHHARGYRRAPARVTLVVAAATMAAAAGVSAGVAVAASAPHGPASTGLTHASGPAAGAVAGSPARVPVPERDSEQAIGSGQARPRPSARVSQTAPAARHTAAPVRNAAKPAVARPYLIYDSLLPAALPSGHVVATYADGPGAVSPGDLAGRGPVLWIDVNATDPAANALDIEPGNATPSAAPGWVSSRLSAYPGSLAIIYASLSEWPAVQAAVATLPADMRARIRWWIADPTGYAHLVPGSDATQWYWGKNYDISTATPRFLTRPVLAAVT